MRGQKAISTDTSRVCTKCGIERTLIEFNRRPITRFHPTPFHTFCRWCETQTKRQYVRRSGKRLRDPIRNRAQMKLRDAVRRGKIIKPRACDGCSRVVTANLLHGHHHNGYENALDVLWLCHSCHALAHVVR